MWFFYLCQAEQYEKERGWDFRIIVDGWSEDNYIVKYFCKSLTLYLKNYINKINGISRYKNYIPCEVCGVLTEIKSNRTKYCDECARGIEKKNWVIRKRRQRARENVTI